LRERPEDHADVLLLEPARLMERRSVVRGPLSGLHRSLREELQPVIDDPPAVPLAKALLSRAGGRCERDGTPLDFDPRSPDAHRCPRCGTMYQGELHHRAWITSFQLWLAERCVHASLFAVLDGSGPHAGFARDVLLQYAERYAQYPNRDNVLGPTRLFFSTYLESIWLLQICIAASLLEQNGDARTAAVVRDRVIAPSSALIAEYDEGMSNRQVWNNAALLAAARMLDDAALADRVVCGSSGIEAHLTTGLLADGSWYEGENYHQFALRGLWYGVLLAERNGRGVRDALTSRFESAFVAPFLTALPDFTFPSRKDSQYAVSLRQWRVAEQTELGFARSGEPRLAAALARCYESGHERRDTGRARSTADVERNGPSSALTRADLGWRALLFAAPDLPAATVVPPRSALMEHQGIAVFRRDGGVYVGFEFGQSGGGHGHPDRLNLMLSVGDRRILDDLGTGSYVDPSLHWYRSTLAHNAPLIDGASQPLHDGMLRAYDEREGLGWAVGTFQCRDGVHLERAILVAPGYLVDELTWRSPQSIRVEVPFHIDVTPTLNFAPATLDGGSGVEDGFSFVSDASVAAVPGDQAFEGTGAIAAVSACSDAPLSVFRGMAPGQPASTMRAFLLLRAEQAAGRIRTVLSWTHPTDVTFDAATVTVDMGHGERHVHRRDDAGWHVALTAGGARSSVDLDGFRRMAPPAPARSDARPAPVALQRQDDAPAWLTAASPRFRELAFVRRLTEAHYRRSEDNWDAAGNPRAEVAIVHGTSALVIYADIRAGDARFMNAQQENRLDNEHPDTMGAGMQLYVRTPEGSGAWSLVPELDGDSIRVRAIAGWGQLAAPRGRWRQTPTGYEVRLELPLPAAGATELPIDLDLLINETTADRERRRGQLILSGAAGEFVYLVGDRHDATRLLPFVLVG